MSPPRSTPVEAIGLPVKTRWRGTRGLRKGHLSEFVARLARQSVSATREACAMTTVTIEELTFAFAASWSSESTRKH